MAISHIKFTWNPNKAKANLKKHGVSFEEAQICFYDPMHIVINDPDHSSGGENRMILIGLSLKSRLVEWFMLNLRMRGKLELSQHERQQGENGRIMRKSHEKRIRF